MSANPKFSSSLHAARFAVGVAVMLVHFIPLPLASIGTPAAILQILNARNLTSSFFFLLSGFLVAITASRSTQVEQPLSFAVKRLCRLWPAHVAGFVLMIPSGIVAAPAESLRSFVVEALSWITMSHGFFPSFAMQYNGPAWAVTSFALGYLFVPCLVGIRHWPLSRLLLLALSLWLAPLAIQCCAVFGHAGVWDSQVLPRSTMSPDTILLQRFLHSSPLFRVPEILAGSLLALCLPRIGDWHGEVALAWLTPFFLTALLVIGTLDDRWLFILTHGALTPVLLLMLAALWRADGWMERVCRRAWLKRAGQCGILIYFLHRPVFRLLDVPYRFLSGATVHQTERSLLLALVAALSSVLLAYLVQPAYDSMCKRLANFLLERRLRNALANREVVSCVR